MSERESANGRDGSSNPADMRPPSPPLPAQLSGRLSLQERANLFSIYNFRDESPLKRYLEQKTNRVFGPSSLLSIRNSFKEVLLNEQLFDARNPEIILPNRELEEILDVR